MKPLVRIFICFGFLLSEMATAFTYSQVKPLQSFAISKESYEDIRIDADKDGIIDFWYLRNNDTIIYISFQNREISEISIQKFDKNLSSVANFVRKNKYFVLTAGFVRPIEVYNGEPACEKSKPINAVVAELKKSVSLRQRKDAAAAAVVCSDEEAKLALSDGLFTLLADKNITSCFADEKLQSVFRNSKTDLNFLSEKVILDITKIENQASDTLGLIECSSHKAGKISGTYTENGKISVGIPKNAKPDDIRNSAKSLILHELIHRAGLKDDNKIDAIVNYCISGKLPKEVGGVNFHKEIVAQSTKKSAKATLVNVADESKSATPQKKNRAIASTAAEKGGSHESVNIAKEVSIAEVQQAVPKPENLAVHSINMTDEGKAQAVAASERQSAPVFAMADLAMGVMNTPALASDDSASSGYSTASTTTSSSTSSSRSSSDTSRASSGERYQARHGRYQSKTSDSKSSGSKSDSVSLAYMPSKQARDEQVVREVDLTQGANSSSETGSSASARGTNSRTVASTARTDGEVSDAARSVGSGTGSSSSTGSGSGSGTYFANGNSSNTRKTNTQTRSTASLPPTALPEKYGTRDRVLDQFSGSSHSQVKSLIKSDSDFKRALETYEIKVVDSYGGVYGSSTGKTIYSDTGSEFLMIRRK